MNGRVKATALLGGIIEPIVRCRTPQAAREILALRADEDARRRVEELGAKSNEGQLTPDERAEYQLFVEVGDIVALLQARARRLLAEHPGS